MTNEQTIARTEARISSALELFEAGFTCKARQTDAKSNLSSAYDKVRELVHNAAIAKAAAAHPDRERDQTTWSAYIADISIYDLPFSLTHLRPKHLDAIRGLVEYADTVLPRLIELLAQVKAAPIQIIEKPSNEVEVKRVAVLKTLEQIMETRKAQFVEAVALGEQFGGLPVSVNAHYVWGHKGTTFIRHFFYLRGKLTPLAVIVAAMQELEAKKKA